MQHYDYVEFYNSPQSVLTPEDEFMEWCREHDPIPTEEDLQQLYEQMEE